MANLTELERMFRRSIVYCSNGSCRRAKICITAFAGLILILVLFVEVSVTDDCTLLPFYILPVSLVTVYVMETLGYAFAFTSVVASLMIQHHYQGALHSHDMSSTISKMIVLLIMVKILTLMNKLYLHENIKASTDGLTGLFNRSYFYSALESEFERSRRYDHTFSMAYIDLDNFKLVNDRYGHLRGDTVLQVVGRILRENVRTSDTVCRLGGDEFVIIMSHTTGEGALTAIKGLNEKLLQQMRVENLPVTFSIGIVSSCEKASQIQTIIDWSDRLMYNAKNEGGAIRQEHF